MVMALPELDRIQTLIQMETYDAISKLLLPALRRFTDQITSHGITLLSDSEAQGKRKYSYDSLGNMRNKAVTLSEAKNIDFADKERYAMSTSAEDRPSEAAMLQEAEAHDRKERRVRNLNWWRKRKRGGSEELGGEGGTIQAPVLGPMRQKSSRERKETKPYDAPDGRCPARSVVRRTGRAPR